MRHLSDRTRADYQADFDAFSTWRASRGAPEEAPSPEEVARYLLERAGLERDPGPSAHVHRSGWDRTGTPLSVGALRRVRAAIDAVMGEGGHPPPSAHPAVQQAWARVLRHERGDPLRSGLRLLDRVLGGELKEMARAAPDTLLGVRDRLLLLVGAGAGLTPGEVCALGVGDVAVAGVVPDEEERLAEEFWGERAVPDRLLAVSLPEGGEARLVAIEPGLDPVRAYQAWLSVAGLSRGPLFRGVNRHGRVGRGALRSGSVSLVVRRAAELAGLDEPQSFSGADLVELTLPQEEG